MFLPVYPLCSHISLSRFGTTILEPSTLIPDIEKSSLHTDLDISCDFVIIIGEILHSLRTDKFEAIESLFSK